MKCTCMIRVPCCLSVDEARCDAFSKIIEYRVDVKAHLNLASADINEQCSVF